MVDDVGCEETRLGDVRDHPDGFVHLRVILLEPAEKRRQSVERYERDFTLGVELREGVYERYRCSRWSYSVRTDGVTKDERFGPDDDAVLLVVWREPHLILDRPDATPHGVFVLFVAHDDNIAAPVDGRLPDHSGVLKCDCHRVVRGHGRFAATGAPDQAPQALTLTTEPQSNVERYDALRRLREARHAS
jgi:hypothetical protein